jgi:hypothetical protein
MIYDNLLNNLPAIVGLSFAGVWLIYTAILIAYKLSIIREFFNWFKDKPIIIPSLFFIASPFIFTLMYECLLKNTEFIKTFTPISCITVYIAYQQYQLNRQNLRKSLSDKRLTIYVATMTLIATARAGKPEIIQEKINNYLPILSEANFLLSEEINQKLEELCSKAYDFISLKSSIDDAEKYGKEQSKMNPDWYESEEKKDITKELINNSKKTQELREYFVNESPKIKSLFYPYIDLSKMAIN